MKSMFEPWSMRGLSLKNRLVRSATVERLCSDEGRLTDKLGTLYADLSAGEVGLIITGMLGVTRNSCVMPNMGRVYAPEFVGDFRKIADSVHALDGRIVVQLSHCGVKAAVLEDGGLPAGASEIELRPGKPARAMSKDEIAGVVRGFGEAAARCREAGADGVQLHAAHGYMLSQFLSPYFNRRSDEYGGPMENRGRILIEAYEAVRARVGTDYPVMIKINCTDLAEPSISLEEFVWICSELERRGLDAVEVSAGLGNNSATSPIKKISAAEADEAYFAAGALELSSKLDIPVLSVGGYRTPAVIEGVLNRGKVQAISLCRPFISEPHLAKRWKNGDLRKARCISCNKCFGSADFGCQVEFK